MGYSSVTVFGDSLIDAGNALRLAEWYDGLPFTEPVDAAPTADKGYFDGRFSNGYTFADLLSNKYVGLTTKPIFPFDYEDPYLGLKISPFASDPSGKNLNFAYGGAQLLQGDEAVPDLDGQTDAWRDAVDGKADPSGLYIFSFGANDVHDLVPKTGAWASLASAQRDLQAAADKYAHEIMQAIEIGVREILVVGVPDIGVQPYYNGVADEAARRAVGTQYSMLLDQMVRTAIDALTLPTGVHLQYASFAAMSDFVLGEMTQIYGTEAIYPLNASSLVFFDKVHPTTQIHALAAGAAVPAQVDGEDADVLTEPVRQVGDLAPPEPVVERPPVQQDDGQRAGAVLDDVQRDPVGRADRHLRARTRRHGPKIPTSSNSKQYRNQTYLRAPRTISGERACPRQL